MNTSGTVRLSIEIPIEVNEQLATFLQWGTKAEAIRALVELLIRTQLQNKYIVSDLLAGRCKLDCSEFE